MTEKDTERLENELRAADDVEKFCKANADNFRKFTLAAAMELSPKDANRLLHYAGHANLYVRDEWDSVIIFGLKYHYGIEKN